MGAHSESTVPGIGQGDRLSPDETRRSLAIAAFAWTVTFFCALQVFCLWSGALGIPCGRSVAIAFLIAAAGIGLLFAARLRGRASPRGLFSMGEIGPSRFRSPPRFHSAVVSVLTLAAAVWSGAVWIRLWVLARARPPYDWDGLYYHLPAISGWAARGRVMWLDGGDVPFVNFPMGVEVTSFVMHRALDSSRLTTAGNLWYWPLAFLAVMASAEKLGVRGRWRWLSAAWIVSAPVIVCQSVSCYTDPGFAATVMAAIASTLILISPGAAALGWRFALWGMSLGLMAGAKGGGAPYVVVLVAVALVGLLIVRKWRDRNRWIAPLAGAACAAFLVGGYWYARNALMTGNPIHPIAVKFGAKGILPGYDHVAFSEANLPAWLAKYPVPLRMFVSWLQTDAPIHGYAPVGGLGFLWLFGCVPAITCLAVLWWRRRLGASALPFAVLAASALALLAVQTSPWWSRFTVWMLGLGLPALALVLQIAFERARRAWRRGLAALLVAAAIAVTVWESNRTLLLESGFNRAGPDSAAQYLTTADAFFPGFVATPGIDEFLAADKIARSPWSRLGTLFGGVLAQPLGARVVAMLPGPVGRQELERLRSENIRWIVWDRTGAGPVPDLLLRSADEHLLYNPNADADFHFLRLDFHRFDR